MLLLLLIGFSLGFLGSVPIAGPIAALVLRRGLEGRMLAGLGIALGCSLAEGAYAYVAFWGLGALLHAHPWLELASRVLGAVMLIVLGVLFVIYPPRRSESSSDGEAPVGLRRNVALGFTVTALNPTLIATWGAAVTMGYALLPFEFVPRHALPFAMGAAIGIVAWFSTLLSLLNRFQHHLSPGTWANIGRITGALLLAFGTSAALRSGLQWLHHS